MSRIRARDTGPESEFRTIVHALGLRFQLYRKDLAGSPDLMVPRHRALVFRGCF